MRIQVEDIQKDMNIDEDVYSNQGNLIVGRGFSVSNAMILKNLLRQHKVDKVKVLTLSEEVAQPSPQEKIEQEIVDFKLEFHDTVSTIENEISRLMNADYVVATSGIAGPEGGSKDKPVGTTWIGIATPEEVFARQFLFGDNRERNIRRTALQALNMLRKKWFAMPI